MQTRIEVENIRCGGCANTIRKKLLGHELIEAVEVDIEGQAVTITSTQDIRADAVKTLFELGYPERGSVAGLTALQEKARSVVSCAIGRMDLATKG